MWLPCIPSTQRSGELRVGLQCANYGGVGCKIRDSLSFEWTALLLINKHVHLKRPSLHFTLHHHQLLFLLIQSLYLLVEHVNFTLYIHLLIMWFSHSFYFLRHLSTPIILQIHLLSTVSLFR